jgi:hypothetical protein
MKAYEDDQNPSMSKLAEDRYYKLVSEAVTEFASPQGEKFTPLPRYTTYQTRRYR